MRPVRQNRVVLDPSVQSAIDRQIEICLGIANHTQKPKPKKGRKKKVTKSGLSFEAKLYIFMFVGTLISVLIIWHFLYLDTK